MPMRLPQDEDLIELAHNLDMDLTGEEVEEFQALIPTLFQAYHSLEQMPSDLPAIKYPHRSAGQRPSRSGTILSAAPHRRSQRLQKIGRCGRCRRRSSR